MNIAILLALLAATCSHSDEPDPVDRWRPLVGEHFPAAEVSRALCVIGHESGGDPDATFDEWLHWWEQHPDVMHLSDWPRPPRTTQLGRGGDSRYSVGLFQINVGNLAGNRIAGLAGWIRAPSPRRLLGPATGHRGGSIGSRSLRRMRCCWSRSITWRLRRRSGGTAGGFPRGPPTRRPAGCELLRLR